MNETLKASLATMQQNAIEEVARVNKYVEWAITTLGTLNLSDSARIEPSGCYPYIYVSTREDLMEALKLAPRWSKSPQGNTIRYSAEVPDHFYIVNIFASDGGLPATCKAVKKTREIPAQAARVEEYEEIVCDAKGSA